MRHVLDSTSVSIAAVLGAFFLPTRYRLATASWMLFLISTSRTSQLFLRATSCVFLAFSVRRSARGSADPAMMLEALANLQNGLTDTCIHHVPSCWSSRFIHASAVSRLPTLARISLRSYASRSATRNIFRRLPNCVGLENRGCCAPHGAATCRCVRRSVPAYLPAQHPLRTAGGGFLGFGASSFSRSQSNRTNLNSPKRHSKPHQTDVW